MIIFDHGYSTEVDGAGTRLIFYLKGCNFRCDWCGAPESISPQPEIMRYPNRTETAGSEVTIQWMTGKILRCRTMIDGVTFGGGEPTLQAAELTELLQILRKNHIHTALESNASTGSYRAVIKYIDQLFSDLKTVSPDRFASRINPEPQMLANVMENLKFAAENHPDLTIRIPVVSDLNDSVCEQEKIAAFLSGLKKSGGKFKVQLLRQHHLAAPKYQALNRPYRCAGTTLPDERTVARFKTVLTENDLEVL